MVREQCRTRQPLHDQQNTLTSLTRLAQKPARGITTSLITHYRGHRYEPGRQRGLRLSSCTALGAYSPHRGAAATVAHRRRQQPLHHRAFEFAVDGSFAALTLEPQVQTQTELVGEAG